MLAAPFLWPRARPSCGKADAGPCGGASFKANSPGLLTCVSSRFIYLTFCEGPSPVPGRKVGQFLLLGHQTLLLTFSFTQTCPFPVRQLLAGQVHPAMDLLMMEQRESGAG